MANQSDWGRNHILMILSWTLGYLGADRFYNGEVGWGVLKLITLGAFGIWWLVDAAYFTFRAGKRTAA
jgi:TM2 domain-containing membrane protein YozV